MAVNRKAKAIYNAVFDGIETSFANSIQIIQEKHYLRKYAPKEEIPRDYEKAYKSYWKKYGNFSPLWGWYYASRNGNMDVKYIPNTLYYTRIDQFFNNRKLGYGFNDKNYYSKIFDGILQPTVIVRKINGLLFDEHYKLLTVAKAKSMMVEYEEVICKPSQESGSGRGIEFFKKKDITKIENFLTDKKYDNYVVQLLLEQHDELNRIHSKSVNCIRICSLLQYDGVYILSSVLRMGFGDSKVDNATAKDNAEFDGMSCGITSTGYLNRYAYGYNTGKKLAKHPDGVVFEGFKVPSYDKAIELVKECHPRIGNFRLVSWDIAIDKKGNAVLIEANMRKGSINFHQFNNGPLFGELTDKVLEEVFGERKG